MVTIRWQDYIVIDPKVMLGKPVIKNTRITVELVVERLSYGETIEQLLEAYPHLSREDILDPGRRECRHAHSSSVMSA